MAIYNDGDDWFGSVEVLHFVNSFICDHYVGLRVTGIHL